MFTNTPNFLIGLMTFTGQEDDITRISAPDGIQNGSSPLCLYTEAARPRCGDVIDDGRRILVPRVVAGQYHRICPLQRHFSHQGPLTAIAIASAAEHAHQASTTLLRGR